MLLVILRHFGGYTIESLMSTPFCHFTKLFELAEMAENFAARTVLIGTNAGGTSTADDLYSIDRMRFSTKKQYKDTVTQELKDRAAQYARNVNV